MDKYFIKTERKYVIATLGEPTFYLHKSVGKIAYSFYDNIASATKANSEIIANQILGYYQHDTSSTEPLVVLPVDITYELVDETGDM